MRSFSIACVSLGLFLQIGCALAPKMTTGFKPMSNTQMAARFVSAMQLESQDKPEQAREIYKELLAKQPDHPECLHRMGVVCTRLQRYSEANKFYEKARHIDPMNASLLTDMGYSSFLQGDSAKAEKLLREAMHLNPGDQRTRANLATVAGFQGNIEESFALLQSIGNDASALTGLGLIHCQRREYELAEQCYVQALAIEPNLNEAAIGLAELSKHKIPMSDAIAKTKTGHAKIAGIAPVYMKSAESTSIRQASAVADDSDRTVTTVNYIDDSSASRITVAHIEEGAIAGRMSLVQKVTTTLLGDQESADDDAPEVPSTSELEDVTSVSADYPVDDETSSTEQSVIDSSSNANRLTFGPRKTSYLVQPVSFTTDVEDTTFAAPTKISDNQ